MSVMGCCFFSPLHCADLLRFSRHAAAVAPSREIPRARALTDRIGSPPCEAQKVATP